MNDAPVSADTCPRCGGGVRCGANDDVPCACTFVKLDSLTLAALRVRYDGCLCIGCLAQLSATSGADGRRTTTGTP